jgi:hypothetical protein
MLLKHVGLTCSSEDNADKFYLDLLGLNKSEPKTLPSDLSNAIFNIDAELQMINYTDENIHFEIFVSDQIDTLPNRIAHQCLEVKHLTDFIDKCRTLEVEVTMIPKGEKTLTFIKDFDGNLFEIKRSAAIDKA